MTKTELTHIIRQIVAEEMRKELPNAIAEAFAGVLGQKQVVTEQRVAPRPQRQVQRVQEPEEHKESLLKESLREMFAGTGVMTPRNQPQGPKRLAKDPMLNEILNATTPFTNQQRTGASLGAAAMMAAAQGGYSMTPSAPPPMAAMMDESAIMEDEPAYMKGAPDMSHLIRPQAPVAPPVNVASQAELLRDDHIPMAQMPEGVSVLDVARATGGDDPVTKALTKNYSGFLKKVNKASDQRKGIINAGS